MEGKASSPPEGRHWQEISFDEVEVGEQIGGGGFALVYRGEWRGRDVALKTLFDPRIDEALKKEYLDELHAMQRLRHENIVRLLAACMKPPNLCMVLELCDSSLFHLLHNTRANLSEKQLVGMAIDVANGLEYMHTRDPKIIHRDIKSQNVLVTKDGVLKLCDFGLVGTQATTAGTPSYMAPELMGYGKYSEKVDTYAFGVLLWEMFVRAVPYASWDATDVRRHVLGGKRLEMPRSGCPRPCGQLIQRCWDSDPDRRPEFVKISRALRRIYSSMREESHSEELLRATGGDCFDQLSTQVSKK